MQGPLAATAREMFFDKVDGRAYAGPPAVFARQALPLSASAKHLVKGATGFDAIALREEAGRGLLATLNRGTVKMN